MARFLLATIDGGGTAPPAMGTAAELVRRGHAVAVLTDPTLEESARAAGCSFRPWRAAPSFGSVAEQTELLRRAEEGSPRERLGVARRLFLDGTPGYARDVATAAEHGGADAVLAEAAVPGIVLGALVSGRPAAALMANVHMRPTPGVPLMGTGWSPASGAAARLRDALAPRLVQAATGLLRGRINAVLDDAGQPPVRHLFALLDRCAEVLVMTSPSFDLPAPRLPPNVRYVGPRLDDPAWASSPGADWRPGGDGPLVLVGTSSVHQHGTADLLRRVAAALGTLPVRAVVTTGRALDPAEVPAPPGVRVVRAAPHAAVLAEAAVVVTHAGHGTTIKTLAAGVPLVCVPMGRDQVDNTVRVLRLGAGVRLARTAPADAVAAAVREVLGDPRYREAARRFAGTLAEEARTRPSAVDRAEALLGR